MDQTCTFCYFDIYIYISLQSAILSEYCCCVCLNSITFSLWCVQTLCNACGISYMKQVRRGVPGDSSASSSGSASVPPATTATVVEGTSSNYNL